MEKKKGKTLWIVILAVALAVIIGCGTFLFLYFKNDPEPLSRDDFTAPAAETVPQSEETTEDGAAAPTAAPTQAPTVNAFGYDTAETPDVTTLSFEELMELNSDIYAWIFIPGTNVDYPVAQSIANGDDSFYLSHNIYREYQFSGSIYTELQNSLSFTDPVTVVYGHNTLTSSMFTTLLNFEDPDFFDENNTIFIFTKDKVFTYLIYSAYVFDDRHILNSYNMLNKDDFADYIDSTLHPRSYTYNVREGVEITTDDRILTLSTCTNSMNDTRFLVQGVLVDEQPRQQAE